MLSAAICGTDVLSYDFGQGVEEEDWRRLGRGNYGGRHNTIGYDYLGHNSEKLRGSNTTAENNY